MVALVGMAQVEVAPTFNRWDSKVRRGVTGPGVVAAGEASGNQVAEGFERSTSSRLRSVFSGIVRYGSTALLGIAAAAGTVGIRTAAGMETANISFTTMLGSAGKAKSFLSDLNDFAAKTPFDLPGLQQSAQSLVSIGIDADKVIPIMTTLGNVTAGMGTGAEGVQRATVAIQQMNAAGKISAEDLNQLRDAGIPVYELLAGATGKSVVQVAELARQGKLGREELDQLMTALESGKGLERFNGMMEAQSRSLSGLWSTLKDTFAVGMAEAIQPIIPTIKDGLGGAISLVSAMMPRVQAGLAWLVSQGPAMSGVFAATKVAAQGLYDLVVKGDYSGKLRSAFGWEEDNRSVDKILDIRDAAINLFAQFRGGNFSSVSTVFSALATSAGDAVRVLPALTPTLSMAGKLLGWMADNVDLVAKALPYLITAFVTYKGLQAANNVLGRQSVVGMGLQLATTLSLTASNFALAKSQKAVSTSTVQSNVATNAGFLARGRETAATVAGTVAKGAQAVVTKSLTVAQKALNLVLTNNPLGWVLKGIILLVGGFTLLYAKNEAFRGLVQRVWAGVKSAIGVVVNWFTGSAVPWMGRALTSIGNGAKGLWVSYVDPAFRSILAAGKSVFGWVLNTGVPWVTRAVTLIGTGVKTLWSVYWDVYLSKVLASGKSVFGWVRNTGLPWVKTAFNGIGSVISTTVNEAKKTLDSFRSGIGAVVTAFGDAKDGVGKIWGKITSVVAAPVISVIKFLNDKFIGGINSLLSKIPGVDLRLKLIPVPGMPVGLTSDSAGSRAGNGRGGRGAQFLGGGGMVRGPWAGPAADNVLGLTDTGIPIARVNPREWVHPVAAVNYYGPAFMRAIQQRAIPRNLLGMASGGRVGGSLADIGSALKSSAGFLGDILKNPVGYVKGKLSGILSGIGSSLAGTMAKGALGGVAGRLGSWVKDQLFGGSQGATGGTRLGIKGMPWQSIWGMIQAVAPEARMTSNYRAGAITSSGYKSLHSLGRAVDLVSGNMRATFMKIRGLLPWSELYYSPMDALQLNKGRSYIPQGITRAQHFDHLHAGYAGGGEVTDPRILTPTLYDTGGPLPPGDTWVRNRTGGTEWVTPKRPTERGPQVVQHITSLDPDVVARKVVDRMTDSLALLGAGPA